jgi:hypothetical protein
MARSRIPSAAAFWTLAVSLTLARIVPTRAADIAVPPTAPPASSNFYGPAVNLIQSGKTSNAQYVGNQAEVKLEWRLDRHFTFTAEYAHFFAGDFLKQTTPGKDVDYFSAWVTYRF